MPQPHTLDDIRQHWTSNAQAHGTSYAASWNDKYAIELEIQQILRRLADGQCVLDAGCANGYSTLRYAQERRIQIRGVDYIPEMIETARLRQRELAGQLVGQVEFAVGNILELREPADHYDRVVVVRVVINLATWQNQQRALAECLRVLKPGGQFLLSEATVQGWRRMNGFRQEWGLEPVPVPSHNTYLDEDLLAAYLPTVGAQLSETVNFASTYFVGTRVLKPLLAETLGLNRLITATDIEWNRFFALLPAWGDYGTQKLFVVSKA